MHTCDTCKRSHIPTRNCTPNLTRPLSRLTQHQAWRQIPPKTPYLNTKYERIVFFIRSILFFVCCRCVGHSVQCYRALSPAHSVCAGCYKQQWHQPGKGWTQAVNILSWSHLHTAPQSLQQRGGLHTGRRLTFTFRILTDFSSTCTASLPPSALSL